MGKAGSEPTLCTQAGTIIKCTFTEALQECYHSHFPGPRTSAVFTLLPLPISRRLQKHQPGRLHFGINNDNHTTICWIREIAQASNVLAIRTHVKNMDVAVSLFFISVLGKQIWRGGGSLEFTRQPTQPNR